MKYKKIDTSALVNRLKQGEIVAIPTESVYGLSCIIKKKIVKKIITLKHRDSNKGFIVVSGKIKHLLRFIDDTSMNHEIIIQKINSTYYNNRAITWVVPVKQQFRWITGKFNTIAIRLTKYPLLKKITNVLDEAIISTSANLSNHPPAHSYNQVKYYFSKEKVYIYPIEKFIYNTPSLIIDIITNKILRS